MSEIGIELLDRYLAGTASSEERQRVDAWLAEDPRRWAELATRRDEREKRELSDQAVAAAMGEVWGRIAEEIGAEDESPPRVRTGEGRGRRNFALADGTRRPLVALVAAVAVLMVAGGLAATLLVRGRATPVEAWRVAATTAGERASFRLPDGTRVMLGVASTLQYPGVFASGMREVSLEGEAYFDVAHQEGRPFRVRAGNLVAQDLGTRFTVRAYPEDADASVVVRDGKVAIRASTDGQEGVVAPGQIGRLLNGRVPKVEQADTAALFAWIEGRLVFDGIPLHEALPELSRWFDLDFRLADSSLGTVPLTATLKTQPTADVLEGLAASLEMRLRRQGRTVTLYPTDPVQ